MYIEERSIVEEGDYANWQITRDGTVKSFKRTAVFTEALVQLHDSRTAGNSCFLTSVCHVKK